VRKLRRNLKYIVTAVVLVAFVLALAFFVRDQGGGTDNFAGPGAGTGLATDSAAATASASPSPSPSPSKSRRSGTADPTGLPKTLPRVTLTPAEPGGFTYADLPSHSVVLRVTSSAPISGVGYLVPTSPDRVYGTERGLGKSWSIRTTVTGKPDFAAVFVQGGPKGVAVTCTIVIDGRVASSETTHGPYGRQVCLA
jgi:hypothetical protein